MPKKLRLKSEKTAGSVSVFLNAIEDPSKRRDAKTLLKLMKDVTGLKPKMWGDSMVGFGTYTYITSAGKEGEYFMVGFSPRKQNLTVYIMPGYQDFGDLLKKLGPHSNGKSCLYLKNLDDIHLPTLKKMVRQGFMAMKKKGVVDYRKITRSAA